VAETTGRATLCSGKRATIFGVPLDLLTMEETLESCRAVVESGTASQHVVLNASKAVMMEDVPGLREVISRCAIVNADGQSIVWAGRALGLPVPERVAGIDLMGRLLKLSEREGYPVFFLGAKPDVLAEFIKVATRRFPGLRVAGSHDGYFKDDARMAEEISESGARVLFVGMSSPRKEFFLAENLSKLGPVLAVGVGGSFDVWAGRTRRAPLWMRQAGLEWFYRLIQEPRRMWRRYLVGNSRFLLLVLRERQKKGRA
jgi:exopolysaccharide biosynthesis WecB/TagA/CpsF family protein